MGLEAALRGYLLEEALAWLLRSSGYQLLVAAEQDPQDLASEGSILKVRGRGTAHQVDVLGEWTFNPAFSLPVRLFLEAKFYKTPCRIEVIRNAHGVIHDVNENYTSSGQSGRPRRRFQYSYALFSTSGFSPDAQEYAIAHQISLVDLSSDSFGWLRTLIYTTAKRLYSEWVRHHIATFPVTWMRIVLRRRLGTADVQLLPTAATQTVRFGAAAERVLDEFVADLLHHEETELLIGFPSAPFIILLKVDDKRRFIAHADAHPTHPVRIRRLGHEPHAEWVLSPWGDEAAYMLRFTMPAHVERWITETEDQRVRRSRAVKSDFLSNITVYRMEGDQPRVYQLQYETTQFRRSSADTAP
ncbi:hypothetical protein HTZ77_38965 [Nonomuraea sp. SMC257]|uniref:Restriction endonuclease n=1 Tax=Nonomuraea montanisoli TaxID=2741721 RepID=A0A7Y6M6V7_9ACTN|nr:restriction endonuclease [Nonomuraea montanisoli]NUW37338.1 hypothetical protein [Nonomuraea montanisoli]